MKRNYQFVFDIPEGEQREILIARLEGAGFLGFEETLHQLLGILEIDDAELDGWKSRIEEIFPVQSIGVIEDQNWNAIWEAGFAPVTINDHAGNSFVHIRAGFHPPAKSHHLELIITPRMSFGTGHHSTTSLMVTEMGTLNFKGKSVIDFGTGTGVLAILAEKLGASAVMAIDNDEWSINNARDNVRENGCREGLIRLMKADQFPTGDTYDIILANINLNVILDNLSAIMASCKPGGVILFSGLLATDEMVFLAQIPMGKCDDIQVRLRDGWILVRLIGVEGQ